MPLPPPPTRRLSRNVSSELLFKGVFIALIGLAVLLAPFFMAATELRAIVAGAYLVGWFALLLGGVFIAQYLVRRFRN